MSVIAEATYYGIILLAAVSFIVNITAMAETNHKIPVKPYVINWVVAILTILSYGSMNSPTQYQGAYQDFPIMIIRLLFVIWMMQAITQGVRAIKHCKNLKTSKSITN